MSGISIVEFLELTRHALNPKRRKAIRVPAMWWAVRVINGSASGTSKPGPVPGSVVLYEHEVDRWDSVEMSAHMRSVMAKMSEQACDERYWALKNGPYWDPISKTWDLSHVVRHISENPPFSPFTSPYDRVDYLWGVQ